MKPEKKIKAWVFRVGKNPVYEGIGTELKSMQKIVGGYIESMKIGEGLMAIVNEEGKIKGLPLNVSAKIVGPEGGIFPLYGDFFICGIKHGRLINAPKNLF